MSFPRFGSATSVVAGIATFLLGTLAVVGDLAAAIAGAVATAVLLALREPCVVELYSDSKYVIDALEKGWAWGWRKKGWVKSDKKPALNPDLWEMLLGLVSQHEMHYHWVKGHEENEKNNRCDEQAVLESRKFKVS